MVAGKYKLQRQLGRGAWGVVWAAVNVTTSRVVALKLLLRPEPRARERLLREARAAGALKHPNVLDVYDVVTAEDGSPALVLELLEGQTLKELIHERAPLPQGEVAAIGRDVARGLAIAHASGIVHRDLKPANIFLHRPGDDPPVVKVVDFGISKNLLTVEGTLTETGMAVGTPSFMSPEQVRGDKLVDGRTDLWALGVILYEMLSGQRLFDGRPHEVLTHVLVKVIRPVEEIVGGLDPALCRVVSGLLEREPAKRPTSAEEVADWLAAIATSHGERSQRRTGAPPGSRRDPHDTALIPMLKEQQAGIPKIHEDDDDDETTHVAPASLRRALAQKTVPSVYVDEDDEDRTRVAADAEMTAAIHATREPAADALAADQNGVVTVRPPPGPAAQGADAPGVVEGIAEKGIEGPPSRKVSEGPPSRKVSAAPQAQPARSERPASHRPIEGTATDETRVEGPGSRKAIEEAASHRAMATDSTSDGANEELTAPSAVAEDPIAKPAIVEEPGNGTIRVVAAVVLILVVVAVYLLVQRAAF